MATYKPTEGMKEEARRGLDWRKEHGRGGTAVGVARARDIVNGRELSERTVKRMFSFFSRHEVDKKGQGFDVGEDGYPSAGRIAWALWGGNSGFTWSRAITERLKNDEERAAPDALEVGDFVSWNSSGGRARGEIIRVERDGTINVPDSDFSITGTPDDPAALIVLYRGGEETDRRVAHKFSALRRIDDIRGDQEGLKPEEEERMIDADVSTEDEDMTQEIDQRHIQSIEETEDAYIVTFGKSMPERGDEEKEEDMQVERFDRTEMEKRFYDTEDEERYIDEESRMVRVGVSSEQPVERSFGMEVIDHTKESMNLEFLNSGRAPLLVGHDMNDQVGVVERVELDEEARRLRAVVRFGKSQRASEIFDDVRDGIRMNISVGYRIDGKVEREGDPDNYVRVATTPMEISLVPVPADSSQSVGVGRSVSEPLTETPSDVEIKMSEEIKNEGVNLDAVKAEAVRTARKNDSEILALAAKHNKRDLGEAAIREGQSVDQFRGQLLDVIGDDKPLETPASVVDAPVKERREYSLANMLRAQATGDWTEAGLEREVDQEITKNVGRSAEGTYIPDFIWSQRAGALATGATGAVGDENDFSNFVPTVHRGDLFIEALRAQQVLGGLGTTYLSGLTNRISVPKMSAGANVGFVEELGDVADQSGTDAAMTLQPRTLGGYVDISRLMLMEAVPAIEQVIRNDLMASMADKIEYYAINGSGASGQPTGLLNTAGINNLDISSGTDVDALTWSDIIALVKLVEEDNGVVNAGAAGFLSHPAVKAKLASTAKVSSTDSVMILNDPWNNLYGYPVAFSSNVPTTLDPGDGGNDASAVVFGDFSQLVIASFGAPSILVDNFSNSLAGSSRLVLHTEIDTGVRNAVSFAKTDEVSVA